MNHSPVYILGIESSCDETSCSVTENGVVLSNIIATQEVHEKYGGVVPELASRAHQQQIIPVIEATLMAAKITKNQLNGIAFTRGPGLMGSLLVGTSFAKGLSLALNIPLIEVNHMQAHVIANFAERVGENRAKPSFPFLCLTVSGGHTQIVRVDSFLKMQILGETLDDAAGEAFDKVAKMLNLPYPGGPMVDKHAQNGNPHAFQFPRPQIQDLNYSFSGLKTAILYTIQRERKVNPDFPGNQLNDFCASVQETIIDILLNKLSKASKQTGITNIALAGGVSANSGLRAALLAKKEKTGWEVFIPPFEYCTDNAGMIAVYGYYKFLENEFSPLDITPTARYTF